MALTQGAWTSKTVNGRYVATCTVAGTTGENDVYTLKTPKNEWDPTKPWTLFVYVDEDLTAAATSFVNIWGGYSDSFAITGNDTTVAATDGAQLFAGTTDLDAGGNQAYRILPDGYGVSQVTTVPGAVAVIPALPYYAFNVNCGSALQDAASIVFKIVQ